MVDHQLQVTVVWCLGPRKVMELVVNLPQGATVRQAFEQAQVAPLASHDHLAMPSEPDADIGIWGRSAALSTVVQDGDRIECYRPLKVDPKRARRERFSKQGARRAGLFAKRRPQAKPGY